MKKILYLAAVVSVALTSCMNDEFVGDEHALNAAGERPIGFGFELKNATRAGGADAASALSNQFIVYGEKGTITNVAPTEGNLVFPNYQVNFVDNSAYTTTSNTKNWEYVGYTHSTAYQNNITRDPSSTADDEVKASDAAQTIKYWDYSAANYIFTAVSALDADIENGRVKIQKNEYGTGNYDKGYTITLAKTTGSPDVYPTLNKLYFSDRQVIAQSANADRDATNAYGGNVTLTFRNLVSQIRAGIYETIPGYDVKEIKFYISDGDDADSNPDETTDHAFGALCKNTKANQYEGTVTVVYYTNSDGVLENQPKVTASGTPATDLILGNNFNNLSTSALLAKTSAEPTWDKSDKSFTEVMPQIDNDQNLKLTVDYTLWNLVTEETIEVKGATAEIPSQYLQWKPNYRYSYLFKISDKGNGFTNPSLGPAGLWPITFDAIEITKDDGQVEYITTVSEPSITSYAKASAVITDNEYKTGNNIYVAVEDAAVSLSNPVLTVGTNAKLYFVTLESGAAQEITEVSVANALAKATPNTTDKTWTVTDALTKKMVVTDTESALLTAITQIPAADSPTGADLSINGAKFTPAAKYVQVPENTDLTEGVTYYTSSSGEGGAAAGASAKATASTYRKVSDATGAYVFEYSRNAVPATGTYVAGKTYYTDVTCETTVDTTGFVEGVTDVSGYYLAPAVKVYKVINVVAAP